MATATNDQFLFAIIKQMDGNIDWQQVANECGIVTKGAASKRFSRWKVNLEKAVVGTSNASPDDNVPTTEDREGTKAETPGKKTSKKRKVIEQVDTEDSAVKKEEHDAEA